MCIIGLFWGVAWLLKNMSGKDFYLVAIPKIKCIEKKMSAFKTRKSSATMVNQN
jgi:hypothetical protein